MGKSVEEWWGALLREKYTNRSGAVDEFDAFCDRENIEHEWQSWV